MYQHTHTHTKRYASTSAARIIHFSIFLINQNAIWMLLLCSYAWRVYMRHVAMAPTKGETENRIYGPLSIPLLKVKVT